MRGSDQLTMHYETSNMIVYQINKTMGMKYWFESYYVRGKSQLNTLKHHNTNVFDQRMTELTSQNQEFQRASFNEQVKFL